MVISQIHKQHPKSEQLVEEKLYDILLQELIQIYSD